MDKVKDHLKIGPQKPDLKFFFEDLEGAPLLPLFFREEPPEVAFEREEERRDFSDLAELEEDFFLTILSFWEKIYITFSLAFYDACRKKNCLIL